MATTNTRLIKKKRPNFSNGQKLTIHPALKSPRGVGVTVKSYARKRRLSTGSDRELLIKKNEVLGENASSQEVGNLSLSGNTL